MDKIQFDRVLKPLIEIYDEIELDIIRNILERLKNYTNVEGSLEWYLEKLVDLGTFRSDNLKIFKKNHKKIEKELKNIINTSARHQDYMEVLESYYEKGLLKVNPSDLYNGTAFNRIIDNALKDTNDITDLIQTKALEGANESYKNILNKAYIETSSGVYSYQESIRRALKEFAKEGIKTVHYASGKTLGIESVVRRDVVTRVNKLVGDIDLENARELGTNLVYVDQHLGARVRTPYMKNDYEAHAEWQGKVYMIDGSNDKYDNFFEKTGYGEMLGLKGINCYHGFRAFFEWEDIPKEVDKEENKKKYELYQKQRAYERKIRRLKREREVYKEFDKDKYKEVNTSLQSTYKELDKFIDDNNLRRDYSREYTNKNIKIKEEKFNSYEDVKEELIQKAKKNPDEPIDIFEYKVKDNKGKNILYTSDNALFDTKGPNSEELSSIEKVRRIFGWDIGIIRRINNPEGIRTPDIQNLITKEYWDIKGIHKSNTEKSKRKKISRAFDEAKNQTTNIIIDLNRKDCDLTNDEAIQQIMISLNREKYDWIEQVILLGKEEFVKYYKKK